MAESIQATGQCICGAISVEVLAHSKNIGACHCKTCRTWGGGPLLAIDCGTEVQFKGEENLSIYNSSDWAERGFCKQCGSHLFYRLKEANQYMMPVGLFSDNNGYNFDHQIFIDEKPDYYCFANKTEDMTGAEVFAKYAPQDD